MSAVRQITGVLGSVLTLNLRCKNGEVRTGLSELCASINVHAHLWVPLNPSSLLADACFVRLGIDNFQQVQGIVDTSGGEALDLLGFVPGLLLFHLGGIKIPSSGKCARTCGLSILLFISGLIWCGFFDRRACFLLREETGGFRLTGELLLTFGLLIDALIFLRAILPLGCL